MNLLSKPVVWLIYAFLYLALACVTVSFLLGLTSLKTIIQEFKFKETTCMVLDKKLEKKATSANITPIVDVQYEANNTFQTGKAIDTLNGGAYNQMQAEKILEAYTSKQSYPCWHDEKDPSIVVFHKTNALQGLIKHFIYILIIIAVLLFIRKKTGVAFIPK